VTPANPSITKGATQQFTATGNYSDGSTQNLTASVMWTSLNPSLATITTGGLATGVGTGNSTISATLNGITGSATLTVTAPTLVQHVSGSNTRNNGFLSPFCYSYQLPGLTTAGNSVVVGFTFKNQPTPTVTDDKGDSYTIAENFFDSTDGQSVGIAVAFNVAVGARVINLCFSSDPGGNVQPMATEFDNLTGVDSSGTGNQGTGTSVTAGNMTPTASGDLVYQVVASLSGTLNQSSFTAGSQPNITWNLLSADLMDGWAGQYGLYNATSVINPTMSMGTSGNWVSAAILLRTGNSGSVPSGMRIVHLVHENIPTHTSAGGTGSAFPNPLSLQFPSSGNLLGAMIGGGNNSQTVTSMTDTNNNTWSQAGSTFVISGNDTVQTYYAGNATSSGNLGLTLNWTVGLGDFTIFFYDVVGAASSPLDTTAGNTGIQTATGNLTMPFTITPATPNEIVFAEVIWDFNTGTGLLGQLFDTNIFSGESLSGPEPVDQNNGWGHVITTTTTAPIGFTWTTLSSSLPVGNWAGMAAAFKAANITGPDTTPPVVAMTAPVNGATVSGAVTVSATATDADSPVSFVQFLVDGANTGSPKTTAPYSISLDTTTLSNAAHTLTAVAQDPAGNQGTSAAVTITVSNPPPSIASLNPASAAVGTSVTITGSNFGTTHGTSTVTFNGTAGRPTSWSAMSIVVPVPTGATTGSVVVTVGGRASNRVNFTVVSAASIAFVQSNSADPQSPQTTVAVPFITAQTAGNLNVVIVGWNDSTARASSVVDSMGNAYAVAIGPTVQSGLATQAIYYAKNILPAAANGNIVTVTFTAAAVFPDIRIAEYKGLDTVNPVDVSVGAQGSSATSDSGAVTTNANDLLVGANLVQTATTGPGVGYTSRVITAPDGSILEDQVVTATGSHNATAPVSPSGAWIMQMVAFRAASGGGGAAPSITSLNPTSGVVGTSVTINGTNFGATQGTSSVTFNGATAMPTRWSATSIVVPVPTGVTTGSVVVTVGGVASNGASFTVTIPAPSITSLNPTSGVVGTSVTITGTNFGATQGASTVTFNGMSATPTSWSATSIVAPAPAGATTGNVVVTVGGVASNGVGFTVVADTTAPVVTITAPANNATISATITLMATATDADSPVSFVQFLVDGANTGSPKTTAPYSISLDTTTLSNAAHTLTAVAQDPAGNQGTSAAVTITVSNATGPLRPLASNPHYFTDGSGKAILLTGSQTWDTFQDLDQSSSPAAFDFTAYVTFLKLHGHNVTILWRKDLPTYCSWGAGGTWHVAQFPWKRTGGSSGNQVASDGLPAFDLTQLDQAYFDRLRARVIQLQQNGIYAVVELFDGLGLSNNRCANDGYPFTGGNNVNGVDDGGGTNSMTMTSPNAITGYQDALVQKVIDTVNDQPNVLWEPSEEAPDNSTWWQGHMITLIHTYEAGKAFQHPVGYASLNVNGANDGTLYNSDADWVAPVARISPPSSCGSGRPACKVNINDSDHSYFGMWNDSGQVNRNYLWENFANGNQVMFMDPYLIYWTTGNRNLCQSPSNGVCTGPDARWNNMRDNLGYTLSYAKKMDLAKMTPQGNLTSTGFCLADNVATGAEYLVYAPNGGTLTVNLSATTRVLNVEWFDPVSGTTTSGGMITGGSTKSFTPPFSGDAVLYIVDAAGHN
jgi:hypothetical protein